MKKLVSWYLNLKMRNKLMLSYGIVITVSLVIAIAFSYNLSEKYMSYVVNFGEKSVAQSKEQLSVLTDAIEQDLYYKCSGSPYINQQLKPTDEHGPLVNDKLKYKAAVEYILGSSSQYEFVFYCDKNATYAFAKNAGFNAEQLWPGGIASAEELIKEEAYLKGLWGNCEWRPVDENLCIVKRAVYSSSTLKYLGFVVVGVRTKAIDDIFINALPESTGYAVFNSLGDAVFYSSGSDLENCKTVYNERKNTELPEKGSLLKKKGYVAGMLQTKNKKYEVVYLFSAAALAKDFLSMAKWNIAASSLVFCLAAVFALLISGNITKNINVLLNRLKTFTKGDFESRIEPLSHDEIGELAVQFNGMSEQISTLVDELSEQKIKKQQIEYQMLEQRYSTLQAQLNPHFLYNVLESVSSMAKLKNAPEVSQLICTLSVLLRDSLNQSSKLVSLETELEHIKKYTALYKAMYGEKIKFVFEETPPQILSLLVPNFILQPLVENAILHGVYKKQGNGTITIRAVKTRRLKIIIEDDGVGINASALKKILKKPEVKSSGERSHIGVASVKSRIQLLFGEKYGVQISSKEGQGTSVTVSLPLNAQAEIARLGLED